MPDDLNACQQLLVETRHELSHVEEVLAQTTAVCDAQQRQLEQIKAELELLKRYHFGRRSERFVESPAQGRLFDEPAEASG